MNRFSKRLFLFLTCLLVHFISLSQNLVPNPSFEQYTSCPNNLAQIYDLVGWWNPNTVTSPDFFHCCCSNIFAGTPANFFGYQNARTGCAYTGIFTYNYYALYRENIEIKLSSPLKNGGNYIVEFYVSLADSVAYASNSIGAYFSPISISYSGLGNIPVVPQVKSSNILLNKNSWEKVSGKFTANGGEEYLVIGNFFDDNNTQVQFVRSGAVSLSSDTAGAYYYIDDVSVIENSLQVPNIFTPNSDNVNDVLQINGLSEGDKVQIFNRWGTKIFESSSSKTFWDGRTTSGIECVSGIYYIIISNETLIYKGFVHLLR